MRNTFQRNATRKSALYPLDTTAAATSVPPAIKPELALPCEGCALQAVGSDSTAPARRCEFAKVKFIAARSRTESFLFLRFGQFISTTLSITGSVDAESSVCANSEFDLRDIEAVLYPNNERREITEDNRLLYDVYVRNRCLNILVASITHTSGNINQG